MERPPSPIVVDGEEESELDAVLMHKGTSAWRVYHVLWQGYPITEASWEPELHLHNAPQILKDYLRHVATMTRCRRRWNHGHRRPD